MSNSAGAEEEPLDVERGSQLLERLYALNAAASAAQAEAAVIAGRLAGCGITEQIEGLPLELALVLQSRLRDTDARFLITAGEVLEAMPVTAGLLAAGQLSWSVVRDIVWQVRRHGAAVRGEVDQRIAATLHDHGDLTAFDPDKLLWAVEQAILDTRRPDAAERSERRRRRANYLAVQTDLDGGIRGHFVFDPITGAIILNALDDAADAIANANADADGEDRPADDGNGDGDGEGEAWRPDTARGRQYGRALERLAERWLSGGRDARGRARPLVIVRVDLADVRVNAAGIIELNTRGALPTLTLAALDQLATDAALRTVIFDGARPLAAAAKTTAARIPADTRFAVTARDLACRFPGSPDPIGWCDVHHLIHQEHGGDHDPRNLAGISRRHHTIAHRHGWTLTLDPATGAITATRRGRSYTSLPPGTPLSRPPDKPDRAGGRRSRRRPRSRSSGRDPDPTLPF